MIFKLSNTQWVDVIDIQTIIYPPREYALITARIPREHTHTRITTCTLFHIPVRRL